MYVNLCSGRGRVKLKPITSESYFRIEVVKNNFFLDLQLVLDEKLNHEPLISMLMRHDQVLTSTLLYIWKHVALQHSSRWLCVCLQPLFSFTITSCVFVIMAS
jgi:hypothetical protein